MPELPEVITISNDLNKEITGKKIVKIKTYQNYPLNPAPELFKKYVLGATVVKTTNVAKLILIELSTNNYLASHLRMTGNILYNIIDPYVKITLTFDSGDKLSYSSVRMFGFFEIWNKTQKDIYIKKFGPSALDKEITSDFFENKLKSKKTNIKNALLEQKLISGIGNIYANDALYMANIHPRTKTENISKQQYETLFNKVQEILLEGIKNRGSSIDRYRDLYGQKGHQQEFFRVYGKEGQICKNCGITHIIFEKLQGRGTYFCPKCQQLDKQPSLI